MPVSSYSEDVAANPRLQVIERYPSGAPKLVVEKSKYQASSGQGESEYFPIQITYDEQGRRVQLQEQNIQGVGRNQQAPVPTRSETYDAESDGGEVVEYPRGFGFPEAGSSSDAIRKGAAAEKRARRAAARDESFSYVEYKGRKYPTLDAAYVPLELRRDVAAARAREAVGAPAAQGRTLLFERGAFSPKFEAKLREMALPSGGPEVSIKGEKGAEFDAFQLVEVGDRGVPSRAFVVGQRTTGETAQEKRLRTFAEGKTQNNKKADKIYGTYDIAPKIPVSEGGFLLPQISTLETQAARAPLGSWKAAGFGLAVFGLSAVKQPVDIGTSLLFHPIESLKSTARLFTPAGFTEATSQLGTALATRPTATSGAVFGQVLTFKGIGKATSKVPMGKIVPETIKAPFRKEIILRDEVTRQPIITIPKLLPARLFEVTKAKTATIATTTDIINTFPEGSTLGKLEVVRTRQVVSLLTETSRRKSARAPKVSEGIKIMGEESALQVSAKGIELSKEPGAVLALELPKLKGRMKLSTFDKVTGAATGEAKAASLNVRKLLESGMPFQKTGTGFKTINYALPELRIGERLSKISRRQIVKGEQVQLATIETADILLGKDVPQFFSYRTLSLGKVRGIQFPKTSTDLGLTIPKRRGGLLPRVKQAREMRRIDEQLSNTFKPENGGAQQRQILAAPIKVQKTKVITQAPIISVQEVTPPAFFTGAAVQTVTLATQTGAFEKALFGTGAALRESLIGKKQRLLNPLQRAINREFPLIDMETSYAGMTPQQALRSRSKTWQVTRPAFTLATVLKQSLGLRQVQQQRSTLRQSTSLMQSQAQQLNIKSIQRNLLRQSQSAVLNVRSVQKQHQRLGLKLRQAMQLRQQTTLAQDIFKPLKTRTPFIISPQQWRKKKSSKRRVSEDWLGGFTPDFTALTLGQVGKQRTKGLFTGLERRLIPLQLVRKARRRRKPLAI